MKKILTATIATTLLLSSSAVNAEAAKSEKHAQRSVELRQSVFKLLGSNMGPLGAMAKGKIAFDAKAVEKHALRINQLSHMIADYTKTDTSRFDVKTEALNKIWQQPEEFSKRINALSVSSENLMKTAATGNESAIKKAIGGVGQSCGGCHDNFKKD
ncbi:cytochrome c [Colwelliaceae bacterium 6441]